jgi:uncharacterized HAD superfamily protein
MNILPLGKKMTIAIDVDGTVADCSQVDFNKADNDPNELMKASPIKGAVEAVRKLHREGHTIVFYTARNKASRAVTKKWLTKHGFPFHYIETEKLVAHVYIDDRAINGCDWKRVMKDMKNPNLAGKLARERSGRKVGAI